MKRVLSFVLSLVMILGLISVPAFASDVKTSGYDNLNNNAGDLVIGFLGGSITVADGDSNSMGFNRYATRVTKWFQDKYPAKIVKQVNAGIGGTGSDLGKYRVMTDIGAYAPDVVFVEYAVNDTHYSRLYSETVRSNMETIVRTLQSLPKVPVIVFLYSMHDDSYAKLNYTSIPDHQAVADYYDIETIDFYNYMKPLVEKGDFIWDKTKAGSLTNDNIHPNALGHEQYGKYIISQLESRDILHKNNYGIAPKFESTTVNTRDIKLDSATKSGIWEDSYSGQSDNKYEAIQSTATGDSITLTYTSAGNDSVGVTVLRGEGSYVLDEGTDSEISGTFSVSDSNLPVVKNFASGLSAGVHTVKIVNTADGTEVPHLKLGRLVAHGGREVAAATTAENGDHIPGSKPANLIQGGQTGNIIGTGNNGKVGYTEYKQDYTGNGTIYKFSATDTVTKGSWGGEGVNIRKLTEETQATSSGILYDGYTAKQDTYVFKTRVRALSGTPRIGSATTISWKPTYDNIYKGDGFIPGEEWEDYKTTLTSAGDGFTLCFGFSNAVAGDAFLVDFGDGVYYAPEEAYDVKVETTGTKNEVIAGGKNTYKAELLNQIEIPGTLSQEFTWSVVDAEGNGVEGLTVTVGDSSNEATVVAGADVPFGTYYLKAVSVPTSWQKTLAIEVVEGPADPYAKDYVPGAIPENKVVNFESSFWVTNTLTDSKVELLGTNWINGKGWATAQILVKSDIDTVSSYYGSAGLYIKTVTDATYPKIEMNAEDYVDGDHYVFMFAARNADTSIKDVKLRVGVWNGTYSGTSKDYIPVQEYPDGMVSLPDNGDWVVVKATLPNRATGVAAPSIRMGLPVGSVAGTKVELNSLYEDVQQAYYAKEVSHSVEIEAKSDNSVSTGSKSVFTAKLLNQLGLTGYLNQDEVTFSVGDDKGNPIDGLTVTSDGAYATVSASDDVDEGEYYLRAEYPKDDGTVMRKTLAIKVAGSVENTDDHVAGEIPANLITSPKNSSLWYTNPTYTNSTTVQTKNEWTSDGFAGYAFKTTGTVTSVTNGYQVAAGSRLLPAQFNDYTATEGEHYVIKFAARSLTENTGFGVRIGTWNGAYSGTAKDVSQIMDYENGVANVPGDGEWHTIKGTLPALRAADINDSGKIRCIIVGMAAGTPADVTMELNNHYKEIPDDVPYFAKETAHDIKVTGASDTVSAGGTLNLKAEVINQIETKGALTQSFDWVAVTEDRLSYVDGITFTETNDGANVTVNVADTVPAGDYIIVAQNKTYDMNRQYSITVTVPDYDVTELVVTATANSASVDAICVNADENVEVVIAAYNTSGFVKANAVKLTPNDGVATLAEALSLTGLSTGDTVRVFVWGENLVPFTMKNVWREAVTIK